MFSGAKNKLLSSCCQTSSITPNTAILSSSTLVPKCCSFHSLFLLRAVTMSVVIPIFLACVDMVSDANVIWFISSYALLLQSRIASVLGTTVDVLDSITANTSTSSTKPALVLLSYIFLVVVQGTIFIISVVTIFGDKFIGLRNNLKTSLFLNNKHLEQKDAKLTLDCLSRHDLSLNESSGEASIQSALQWSSYLFMQLILALVCLHHDIDKASLEEVELRFDVLAFSGISSLFSLTMAQFKVLNH